MARDRTRPVAWALTAVAVVSTVWLLATGAQGVRAFVATVVGTAAALAAGTSPLRRHVQARVMWALVVALAFVAVMRPPTGSHDLWSYAMYGRILEHYHRNPYVAVPARFPGDPLLRLAGWHDAPSVYGPLFVAYAACVSRIGGTNALALRLGFQIPVAAGAVAALAVVTRATRDTRALILAGLQPLLWCCVVNGGHNDMYIGLAIVVAVVLSTRERDTSAMVIVAFASLIKPTALLILPILAVRACRAGGRRRLVHGTAAATAVVVGGIAVAPASAFAAGRVTSGLVSRASPWRFVADHITTGVPVTATSVGLSVAIAVVVALRHQRAARADSAATASLAAASYVVVGSYMLPWYCAWFIPAAALTRRRDIATVLYAHAALLFAAYELGPPATRNHDLYLVLTQYAPIVTVAVYAWLTWRTTRARPDEVRHRTAAGTDALSPGALGG